MCVGGGGGGWGYGGGKESTLTFFGIFRERKNITNQPLAESTGLNKSKYALTVIVKK